MDGYNQFFQNPLVMLGAGMMRGADPRGEGLGGLGFGLLNTGQILRQQQQLDVENERARQLADLQMRAFQAQQRQPRMGQTPLWFRDPTTQKLTIGRFGPEGVVFPETGGLEPVRPVQTVDIGGQQLVMPYGAEQPTGVIPKTLPPEALPETRGAQAAAVQEAKAAQAAQTELPGEESQFARTSRYIDELKAHPGLEAGTGMSSILPVMPGSDRADFEARKSQLLGGVFLQGFQMLKGGGPVTEVEGLKAEQAMARMDAATSKDDFVAALEDYREALRDGLQKLRRRAGGTTPPPPPGFVIE